MLFPRLIPCLLIEDRKLVKTVQFSNPNYVGDPINAIKIFNEKEVDEIIILDINATKTSKHPDFNFIKNLASECFMPMCYGGGISTLKDIEFLFKIGIEKISIGNHSYISPEIISNASTQFGSQSVVISIDSFREGETLTNKRFSAVVNTGYPTVSFASFVEEQGAGEILLTSINNEGTMSGFDLDLIKRVTSTVDIPVIAHGGAGSIKDIEQAIQCGASACAIGSMVVYHRKNRSVLINFPQRNELKTFLSYKNI